MVIPVAPVVPESIFSEGGREDGIVGSQEMSESRNQGTGETYPTSEGGEACLHQHLLNFLAPVEHVQNLASALCLGHAWRSLHIRAHLAYFSLVAFGCK